MFVKPSMLTTEELTQRVAAEFCRTLCDWLGNTRMLMVVARNKKETDNGVCHSHDFCDANMAMLAAHEAVFMSLSHKYEFDGENEEQISLWNAAWKMASEAEFKLE